LSEQGREAAAQRAEGERRRAPANSPRPLVIDADGHVIEPPQLWGEYLEPRFRRRAPRPQRDENGKLGYVVDDRYIMRVASSLAARPKTADGRLPTGGFDPQQRLRDMDLEGIDVGVLYPTLSFFFPEIPDRELHAALCRAYNDWLADFCRTDPRRLVGIALLPLDDVEASIAELERATSKLGFRGAFFRPNAPSRWAFRSPSTRACRTRFRPSGASAPATRPCCT
jgi:predicted TIM-barrel fold metal-dependent hydrolase